MNIKKEVANRIQKLLQDELTNCNNKIRRNKYEFEKLAREQTILKRERVKLTKLINDFGGHHDTNNKR